MLAAALALALVVPQRPGPVAPAPAPAEVALPEALPAGAVALLAAPVPPAAVRLLPEGRAIAAGWYRIGDRVAVVVPLPETGSAGAALGYLPAAPWPEGAGAGVRLEEVRSRRSVPLGAPEAGGFVALDLPERASLRALLLRGELERARVVHDGRILTAREEPFPGRRLVLVPPGPAGLVAVLPDRAGGEVAVATASLHAGYPLPAPETFRLPAGQGGEYAFEVPERWSDAAVRFEAFDAAAPGELEIRFEEQPLAPLPGSPARPGEWSAPQEVRLPAERFAHGRASILVFRLVPRGDGGADAGAGLRRLTLDVPLPAAGPFGLGPDGDLDHGGELLVSFWPDRPEAHLLELHAAGFATAGAIAVFALGAELGTIGGEGGVLERTASVLVPAELVSPGEMHTLAIRPAREPWGGAPWSVRELFVREVPRPIPLAPEPPPAPPRPEGPAVSAAPVGQPGQPSLSETIGIPASPPPLPGRPAEPVGKVEHVAAVPVASPAPGEAPPLAPGPTAFDGTFIGPPALPGQAPPAAVEPTGPVLSRAAPSGADGEGAPGAPSLHIGPELPPRVPLEMRVQPPPPRGAELDLRSDPPGARVFLTRAPGHRGAFLGLTPLLVREEASGEVFIRFDLPGTHEALVPAWLAGNARLTLSRTLLAFRGLDFSRPLDPRTPAARRPPEGYAAPAPADLDGDGRIDLVVGGDKGGLFWMRNEEPLGPPRWGPAEPLRRADGRPLAVAGYAAPAAVDWDDDGLVDLLVGARSGEVHFFRRGPLARGLAFEDRGVLVADGVPLSTGNDASPLVVDWNGDAWPDLLVGSGYGTVVLFEGTGLGALTQRGPVSERDVPLQRLLDVVPIDLGDWTGDGLRDLVIGEMHGGVYLLAGRTAGGKLPDFEPQRPVTHRGGIELYAGSYPHGFSLDLDGDGYRDLVFGNSAGELLWLAGGEPGDFDEIEPIGIAPAIGPSP